MHRRFLDAHPPVPRAARERAYAAIAQIDQILRACDEIAPGIWFVLQHAILMPCFAVFPAPTHVGEGNHASLFDPRNPQRGKVGVNGD